MNRKSCEIKVQVLPKSDIATKWKKCWKKGRYSAKLKAWFCKEHWR